MLAAAAATAAAAAASQASPEQAKVIAATVSLSILVLSAGRYGLGNECLMLFRLTIF